MNHIYEVIFTPSYNTHLDFSIFQASDLLKMKQEFVDAY